MAADVGPSCNLDAERAVLGCLLIEGAEAFAKVGDISAAVFDPENHRVVFRAMLQLRERGEAIDLITVAAELERAGGLSAVGGQAGLALLVEHASIASHLPAYVSIIGEHAQKREWMALGLRLQNANGAGPAELAAMVREAETLVRAVAPSETETKTAWSLHDAGAAWTFAPVEFTIRDLLPAFGVIWWGGPPKRFKSLLLLYICLAIAAGRELIAGHFTICKRPVILYVAREDGGSRLQGRRDDILAAWDTSPAAGALHFLIRPRFDLLNPAHVAWLVEQCRTLGVTLLVLDTWTALSPGADPMGAKDQAALAAVVVEIAEAINGAVVVVDHSRKNRAEGEPISSADIYGPLQKWAAAEHIVMLDLTADRRRLEVFVEGKDGDTRRCFLTVTPKGEPEEKFIYAGTVEDIADAQREKGNENRDAVHRALCDAGVAQAPGDVHGALKARGVALSTDTVSKHLRGLVDSGRATVEGKGRGTRYLGITDATVVRDSVRNSEFFDRTRS